MLNMHLRALFSIIFTGFLSVAGLWVTNKLVPEDE